LTARPFLLNQLLAAPVVIEKDKAYVGGKGVSNTGGKVVVFLLREPVVDNVVLLEIKTPVTPLLQVSQHRAGVYGPSQELGGSLTQLAVHRQSLLTNFSQLVQKRSFQAFNPRGVLLIGSVEGNCAILTRSSRLSCSDADSAISTQLPIVVLSETEV
jgi:hypothetical protein